MKKEVFHLCQRNTLLQPHSLKEAQLFHYDALEPNLGKKRHAAEEDCEAAFSVPRYLDRVISHTRHTRQ